MLQVAYTARWFSSADGITDLLSVLVLFLVAFASYRFYLVWKSRGYLLLGASFGLMGVAYAGKLVANYLFLSESFAPSVVDGVISVQPTFALSSETVFYVAFLSYRLLLLAGFYLWFSVYEEQRPLTMALMLFLFAVLQVLTEFKYYVFHLTLAMIAGCTALALFRRYRANRQEAVLLLLAALLLFCLSALSAMLVSLSSNFTLVSLVFQFLGFLAVLITFAQVYSHGKE